MSLLYLRLYNDTDIIGYSENSHTDEFITLEDPLIVLHISDKTGVMYIQFEPLMYNTQDKLFTLKQKDISIFTKPDYILAGYYGSYRAQLYPVSSLTNEEHVGMALLEKQMLEPTIQ